MPIQHEICSVCGVQVTWWTQLADSQGLAVGHSYSGGITGQLIGPNTVPMDIQVSSDARYRSMYSLLRSGPYQVCLNSALIPSLDTDQVLT